MDYGFFKAFEALDNKVDMLLLLVAAIVDEGSDKTAAMALAADVRKKTAALAAAIPANAGTPAPQ